ncbi:uncharacterized protein [Triticum aestivum]|uniref:uncharacterized protein isoform X2 n=1 Tax=Triticum aestivum TaxID=4565 RepID=UPI001D02D7AA|nr:uncharacterized protein LOC123164341 isoform X2 [Triticum aestivum]
MGCVIFQFIPVLDLGQVVSTNPSVKSISARLVLLAGRPLSCPTRLDGTQTVAVLLVLPLPPWFLSVTSPSPSPPQSLLVSVFSSSCPKLGFVEFLARSAPSANTSSFAFCFCWICSLCEYYFFCFLFLLDLLIFTLFVLTKVLLYGSLWCLQDLPIGGVSLMTDCRCSISSFSGMVCPVCRCPGAPCVPFLRADEVPEVFDVVVDEDCFRRMVLAVLPDCFVLILIFEWSTSLAQQLYQNCSNSALIAAILNAHDFHRNDHNSLYFVPGNLPLHHFHSVHY